MAVDGRRLTIDRPLVFGHYFSENQQGEVANLSRNVVIESADPGGVRGHTMYHRHSTGSIAYAEFRHLGKRRKARQIQPPLSPGWRHDARVIGDRQRRSGIATTDGSRFTEPTRWSFETAWVIEVSATDSFWRMEPRSKTSWIATSLSRPIEGKPLPGQVFPADRNEGAGFWWANSQNAFLRNVAVDCEGYGFRFDAPESPDSAVMLPVRGPDGQRTKVDIRTLPFLRFEANETHTQRRYGLNLGGAAGDQAKAIADGKGPDSRHPFAIRDFRVWDTRWALTPAAPGVLIDGVEVAHCDYGFWRPSSIAMPIARVVFFRTTVALRICKGRTARGTRLSWGL